MSNDSASEDFTSKIRIWSTIKSGLCVVAVIGSISPLVFGLKQAEEGVGA